MEITLAVRSNPGAFVSRRGAGMRQRSPVDKGAIWLCPIGVGEDDIVISAPLKEVMHVYLPTEGFSALAELYGDPRIRADSVRYLADLRDPLIWQIGQLIHAELRQETSAGRMMIEAAGLALTARIAHAYGHDRPEVIASPAEADCPKRIQRAIEFIRDNIDREITISELASVACLSPFHFARTFKRITGKSPHRFLSAERFSIACKMLADRETPLVTIALKSGFSNQSAFGTAFKRAVGHSPGAYRRRLH